MVIAQALGLRNIDDLFIPIIGPGRSSAPSLVAPMWRLFAPVRTLAHANQCASQTKHTGESYLTCLKGSIGPPGLAPHPHPRIRATPSLRNLSLLALNIKDGQVFPVLWTCPL